MPKALVSLILTIILFYSFPVVFAQHQISFTEWKQLIPSDRLPEGLDIQKSNNNVDITRFKGTYYLGFRTAPSHFASDKTRIHILSSKNLEKWEWEKSFYLETDLREPRFLIYDDKLFFYFFQGGTNPLGFEPQHVYACELDEEGVWTDLCNIGLDGYIPWRLKVHDGRAYLSAYYGKGIYTSGHQADLRLFTSMDGYQWTPLSDTPQVDRTHAEEGEFEFDGDGNLWGTVRLEGEGALVVYADKNNIARWETKYTPKKYDSALMFCHDDELYLISRRNEDGDMNKLPPWVPYFIRHKYNLIRYSLTSKKTALFKLIKETKELVHLMDLPSTGDTAFPGIVKKNDSTYVIVNYSSDFTKGTKSWLTGQLGKTFIYMSELTFK